jgi:hypothetical protein
MEKNQFDLLMLAITGLESKMDAKITGLKAEMNTRFDAVDGRLSKIEADVKDIKGQTANTVVEMIDLKKRVTRLEGPSA